MRLYGTRAITTPFALCLRFAIVRKQRKKKRSGMVCAFVWSFPLDVDREREQNHLQIQQTVRLMRVRVEERRREAGRERERERRGRGREKESGEGRRKCNERVLVFFARRRAREAESERVGLMECRMRRGGGWGEGGRHGVEGGRVFLRSTRECACVIVRSDDFTRKGAAAGLQGTFGRANRKWPCRCTGK